MIATREDLLNYLEEKTKLMVETARRKNADYAGAGTDPFQNFTRVESLGICNTEVGFLTRMTDKLCRIASFVAAGTLQVKDESVQDTLLDLANYALLMSAYIESKKEPASPAPCPYSTINGAELHTMLKEWAE